MTVADSFPNPLGGDPDTVQRDAAVYAQTADAIARAAAELKQLTTSQFQSQAVSAIGGDAHEVAGTVTRAHVRYRETAEALQVYGSRLREAQELALGALVRNRDIGDLQNHLRYELEETQRLAELPGPDQPMHILRLTQLNDQLQQLAQMQSGVMEAWSQASAYKEQAAVEAMNRIATANEANDLNDGFWDFLGDILDVIKVIVSVVNIILKIVSVILTVLAVIFAVLAVVFPLFAAVSGLLFGYAQLVNLAVAVLSLLQFLMSGLHLLALVLVGMAVVAAFGGAALGSALGGAAKAAAHGAVGALGEGAATLAGEAASKLVGGAIEAVVDQAVEGVLSLGSPDAQALFDAVSPLAEDFLETEFAGGLESMDETFEGLGEKVGSDFAEGFQELGLNAAVGAVAPPLGLAVDAVHSAYRDASEAAGSALDEVGAALQDVSHALDQAAQAVQTAGGVPQVQNDLASALGSPDIGRQVGSAVSGIMGDVLGGLPGGDQAASALGERFGDLAQTTADAARSGHSGASLVGSGSRG
jgi:hypothetical protein